jgi:uncharacterized protein YjiK
MSAYISLLIAFFSVNYLTDIQDIRKPESYKIAAPAAIINLPGVLTEISGITCIDSTTFACIQDETGIVFIYDLVKADIINKIPFSGPGDFEGITKVNRSFYILRSDGVIFEITDYALKSPSIRIYNTGIPAKDNEGICYDSRNKRILVACKAGYTRDGVKNKQLVYSFDIGTKKLSSDPVMVIDIKLLRKLVKENDIKIPGVDKKDIDELDFRASEIGFNPVTGKIYLVSAPDYMMLVCSMSGTIENIIPLKKELFRQAEGITFNARGDMFISNEGAGKEPTIVRFNYIKPSSTATIH